MALRKRDKLFAKAKKKHSANDNDNILFDHNIEIEIIMYNSLKNLIIDWSGDYY